MTYLVPRRPQRRYQRRAPALSGWFDDLVHIFAPVPAVYAASSSTTADCLDQANQQQASFDAQINNLAKTWNPTGFYTPDDVRTLVGQAMAVVNKAQNTLNQSASSDVLGATTDSLMRATDDLARAGSRSLDYLQAAREAEQQGLRTVNIPGLKTWVLNTLSSASSAMVTVSTIACATPWWVTALADFVAVLQAVIPVIGRVLGAVLAIGETALKVAEDLPQLYDILKWGALAAAGYWVWSRYLSPPHAR